MVVVYWEAEIEELIEAPGELISVLKWDDGVSHLLVEGPELSGLLQLGAALGSQLVQLLQARADMVDPVTDDLRVAGLVT